jgi:hypothetical protein
MWDAGPENEGGGSLYLARNDKGTIHSTGVLVRTLAHLVRKRTDYRSLLRLNTGLGKGEAPPSGVRRLLRGAWQGRKRTLEE